MPGVHLIAVPQHEQSLAKAVGRTHFLYTQYVNRLHGRSGHLWQNRFYSSALDEEHFWTAMVYTCLPGRRLSGRQVERNPVRARLVRRAWRYAWSSASPHLGLKDATGLLDMAKWRELLAGRHWREALVAPADEQVVAALRRSTSRGRPLGSDASLSKLERLLGRRVRPLPVGRPRKRKRKTGDCP